MGDSLLILTRQAKDIDMTKKIDLVVSNGQYETAAEIVTVRYTTDHGLSRRITQLKKEHAVYGDNWTGWIDANVAVASPDDEWGDNKIIGGRWCRPANGWL